MIKKSLFMLLMVALIFGLAACGNANDEGNDEGANEGTDNNEAGNEASGDDTEDADDTATRTIEHSMGETPVPANPERIVVLTNHGTEALLSLGITPVGAVQSWTGNPWYEHIAEDMAGVEVVGTESGINVEAIAALQPDLIIGNKLRQEEHYAALSDIAPTVFEEALFGDWKINYELIAESVGKEEQGQEVLDTYNARIEDLRTNLGDEIDTEVSMVRFLPGEVRIYHKDSFSGVILQDIGLARPEAQDVDDFAAMGVTKERINEMDGDVIFYFTYDNEAGEGQQVEDEWINDPLWQNLSAVQAGNAYEVNDVIWNTAGGVRAANLMLDDLEQRLLAD